MPQEQAQWLQSTADLQRYIDDSVRANTTAPQNSRYSLSPVTHKVNGADAPVTFYVGEPEKPAETYSLWMMKDPASGASKPVLLTNQQASAIFANDSMITGDEIKKAKGFTTDAQVDAYVKSGGPGLLEKFKANGGKIYVYDLGVGSNFKTSTGEGWVDKNSALVNPQPTRVHTALKTGADGQAHTTVISDAEFNDNSIKKEGLQDYWIKGGVNLKPGDLVTKENWFDTTGYSKTELTTQDPYISGLIAQANGITGPLGKTEVSPPAVAVTPEILNQSSFKPNIPAPAPRPQGDAANIPPAGQKLAPAVPHSPLIANSFRDLQRMDLSKLDIDSSGKRVSPGPPTPENQGLYQKANHAIRDIQSNLQSFFDGNLDFNARTKKETEILQIISDMPPAYRDIGAKYAQESLNAQQNRQSPPSMDKAIQDLAARFQNNSPLAPAQTAAKRPASDADVNALKLGAIPADPAAAENMLYKNIKSIYELNQKYNVSPAQMDALIGRYDQLKPPSGPVYVFMTQYRQILVDIKTNPSIVKDTEFMVGKDGNGGKIGGMHEHHLEDAKTAAPQASPPKAGQPAPKADREQASVQRYGVSDDPEDFTNAGGIKDPDLTKIFASVSGHDGAALTPFNGPGANKDLGVKRDSVATATPKFG